MQQNQNKMLKLIRILIAAGLIASLSCVKEFPTTPVWLSQDIMELSPGSETGAFRLRLTDFPLNNAQITKVLVSVLKIEIEGPNGTVLIKEYAAPGKQYDLLQLQNGKTDDLGIIFLPPGQYNRIVLSLHEDHVIQADNGSGPAWYNLKIPSGEQRGIRINHNFEIRQSGLSDITLDFDAQKSVKYAPGQGYILRPVITVKNDQTRSGAVGTISANRGGELAIEGEIRLTIPPNALDRSYRVSITPLGDSPWKLKEPGMMLGAAYEIGPHGVLLSRPGTLELPYSKTEALAAGVNPADLKIIAYDPDAKQWIALPSVVDESADIIRADINRLTIVSVGIPEDD